MKNIKLQIIFILLSLMTICSISKQVSAETVYNFFFNPENSTENTEGRQNKYDITQVDKSSVAQSKTFLESFNNWFFGEDVLRLGAYATAFRFSQNVKYIEEKFRSYEDVEGNWHGDYYYSPTETKKETFNNFATTLSLNVFPIKVFGVFGEVSIPIEQEEKLYVSFGGVLLPFRFNSMGVYSDFGVELGYSTFKYRGVKKKWINRYGDLVWDNDFAESTTYDSKIFVGGKTSVDLLSNFKADIIVRKMINYPIWQANAGLSYSF